MLIYRLTILLSSLILVNHTTEYIIWIAALLLDCRVTKATMNLNDRLLWPVLSSSLRGTYQLGVGSADMLSITTSSLYFVFYTLLYILYILHIWSGVPCNRELPNSINLCPLFLGLLSLLLPYRNDHTLQILMLNTY